MGRRPIGRRYPKHISIQVKDIHNQDLKAYVDFLNQSAPLDNQKWGIRDLILTLVYGHAGKLEPTWFKDNHFEKLDASVIQNFHDVIAPLRPGDPLLGDDKKTGQKKSKTSRGKRINPFKTGVGSEKLTKELTSLQGGLSHN